MLNLIDKRLRQIFPAQAHVPFGGVCVALAGDFAQLPPVRDRPLFMPSRIGDSAQVTNGLKMFRSLTNVVELVEVRRQADRCIPSRPFTHPTLQRHGSLRTTPSACPRSIHARVMVRQNISVSHGIVNGSLGTVVGFVASRPLNECPPHAVLVQLDEYAVFLG